MKLMVQIEGMKKTQMLGKLSSLRELNMYHVYILVTFHVSMHPGM